MMETRKGELPLIIFRDAIIMFVVSRNGMREKGEKEKEKMERKREKMKRKNKWIEKRMENERG